MNGDDPLHWAGLPIRTGGPGRPGRGRFQGAEARGRSALMFASRAAAGSTRDTWAAAAAPLPTDCG